MSKPLTLLIIIIALMGFQYYHSLPTGAATTQSTVTVYAPQAPVGPEIPERALPVIGPVVPAVPTPIPEFAKIFYIGDFAQNNNYTVSMGLDEIWIYTFRGKNYTFILVNLAKDYGEFNIEPTTQHLKLFVGQSVWIDSDLNGYSDIRVTLNKIENGRVNVTLEINLEIVLFETLTSPQLTSLLCLLLVALIIDTIIHHYGEKSIFRHSGKRKS
ncbi:MAG: hypothetical protein QW063_00745 [Candidatus Nanoarchaeia archaeon]